MRLILKTSSVTPDFFYVFSIILSSTCSQSLNKICTSEILGANVLKRRIFLPNKIAEREQRVLNYHSSNYKLFNIIWILFGTCKIRRLNQPSNFSRIFDWLVLNWNMSHLIDLVQVQTPYFTWAESNANEENPLFYLISIRFGSCEVRRLNLALDLAFYMHLIRQFDLAHVKCDV